MIVAQSDCLLYHGLVYVMPHVLDSMDLHRNTLRLEFSGSPPEGEVQKNHTESIR
jgi:hypothetical protein